MWHSPSNWYIVHFPYQFISWWISRLTPCPTIMNNVAISMSMQVSLHLINLETFRHIPRKDIVGPHGTPGYDKVLSDTVHSHSICFRLLCNMPYIFYLYKKTYIFLLKTDVFIFHHCNITYQNKIYFISWFQRFQRAEQKGWLHARASMLALVSSSSLVYSIPAPSL